MAKQKTLEHGMLLDAKSVMDDAMSELAELKEFIPECLHLKFEAALERFEDTLCEADIHKELDAKLGEHWHDWLHS
jgi:hypothetical protein